MMTIKQTFAIAAALNIDPVQRPLKCAPTEYAPAYWVGDSYIPARTGGVVNYYATMDDRSFEAWHTATHMVNQTL